MQRTPFILSLLAWLVLCAIALIFPSCTAHAQTAISLPAYTTNALVSVPYWAPGNIIIDQGTVSFCMYGYVSKAAMQSGARAVEDHCYSSRSGATVGVIPSALVASSWPSTLTLSAFSAAAVATAMAVTDTPTPGVQNTWPPNANVPLNAVIYDGSHFQKATTAGWSSPTTAPAWNHSGGTTTESCGVTGQCVVWTDQGAAPVATSFFAAGTVTN